MNDFDDIIKIKTNNIQPARGKILISEPFLIDEFFRRSVVLLAEHNEEGTFGVIVNKPVKLNFNEIVRDFPNFDTQLFLGGPVQNQNLFFIHTLGDEIPESVEIIEGVYWGGDIETIKEMIALNRLTAENIRFYIGYSGWAPEQLNDELKLNSWVVGNINADQLMRTRPRTLWKKSLYRLGGEYAYWPKLPDDPSEN